MKDSSHAWAPRLGLAAILLLTLLVYAGSQNDAKLTHVLRTWAIISYIVGGVGVVAATVFGIIEPDAPTTATRVVPTVNGFVVVF